MGETVQRKKKAATAKSTPNARVSFFDGEAMHGS
jgi:hypothetical protein